MQLVETQGVETLKPIVKERLTMKKPTKNNQPIKE
jgi:hypothetical protein